MPMSNGNGIDQRKFEFQRFYRPLKLLGDALFLHVGKNAPVWKRCCSYVMLAFVYSTISYNCLYLLRLVCHYHYNMKSIFVMLKIVVWCIAAVVAAAFLMRAYRSGELCEYFDALKSANNMRGLRRNTRHMTVIHTVFLLAIAAIAFYCTTMLVYDAIGTRMSDVSEDVFMVFHYRELHVIVTACLMYAMLLSCLAVYLYAFCVQIAIFEMNAFNEHVENIGSSDSADTVHEITDAINTSIAFADAIEKLDHLLKRFAFFMVMISIPATLFALFVTLSRQRDSVDDRIMSYPTLAICGLGYSAITFFPAKLHETTTKTSRIFTKNKKVWLPYRPEVYAVANAFSNQLTQSDLGISIWGFAVLSKPLILTTLSVMVTCLALLLQFSDCSQLAAEKPLRFPTSTPFF